MDNIIQIIIQGGSVGLAVVALAVIYKLSQMIGKLVENHDAHMLAALDRNTEAWLKNAEAITKLTDKIDYLKK